MGFVLGLTGLALGLEGVENGERRERGVIMGFVLGVNRERKFLTSFALGLTGLALGLTGLALGLTGLALGLTGLALGLTGLALTGSSRKKRGLEERGGVVEEQEDGLGERGGVLEEQEDGLGERGGVLENKADATLFIEKSSFRIMRIPGWIVERELLEVEIGEGVRERLKDISKILLM